MAPRRLPDCCCFRRQRSSAALAIEFHASGARALLRAVRTSDGNGSIVYGHKRSDPRCATGDFIATGSGTVIEVQIPIAGPADRNREPDELLAQATTSGSSG